MLAVERKVECVDGVMFSERFEDWSEAREAILPYSMECEENARAGA